MKPSLKVQLMLNASFFAPMIQREPLSKFGSIKRNGVLKILKIYTQIIAYIHKYIYYEQI